jgi:curved DNA-binding protein CbpA
MYQFVDYYALLGVAPEATTEDILEAMAREAREWEPDGYLNLTDGMLMRHLAEARRILPDAGMRMSYDREYRKLAEKGLLPPPYLKNPRPAPMEVRLQAIAGNREVREVRWDILAHKQYFALNIAEAAEWDDEDGSTAYGPNTQTDRKPRLEQQVTAAAVSAIGDPAVRRALWVVTVVLVFYYWVNR